eukprot:PhM_4_TR4624/c1_g1_i1/m.43081/K02155/ATPeV0C, ATP6L; V-type H+-transporting ATPase 16kDa proteolipid subunit
MASDLASPCSSMGILMGQLGVSAALVLSNIGAAYGTAKAGIGVARLGVFKQDSIMRGFVPIIMAGILGIYGLITSVIINNNVKAAGVYSVFAGYLHLGAGLASGMSSLAAGYAIGVVGDVCARSLVRQERIFTGMILMLIFSEALGLYGLIIALLMNNQAVKVNMECPH